MNAAAQLLQAQRLQRAVRDLDDPPSAPGWNAHELADFLPVGTPRVRAAVLVPIVRRVDGYHVLFTRRTDVLREHPGQVSFPGGRAEPGDTDLVATALRETEEETGIGASLVSAIGYLDAFETISGYCVAPVVGFVRDDYVAAPDPAEVAAIFEVPLDRILAPGALRRVPFAWAGKQRSIHEMHWHGHRIWGATASMLVNLVKRVEAVS